ncbi:MDR family MFS transporter [Nocardioides sp. 503]|uniref:MDR family MFS transporter n=1 Tax=Nocardioides sp. 503 TaxID=2508326 RepID=UPI00106FE40B|nr:MDR family MFS transporter [Nocardioides sp. 503]
MSRPLPTAPAAASDASLDPQLRRLVLAIIVGAVAVILDTTIVSVGIESLGRSLDAPVSTIQWIGSVYLLAMFVTIPLTGWAQGRLGSKRLWLLALTTFTVGSVLCALAWDAPSLIAFRALQGAGGGVMMPLMTTVLMQAAGGRSLGRLMAMVSLPAALGPILGPVLGGIILDSLSWRWLFLVNLPLGLVGLVLALRLFPADEPGRRVPLDHVGALLVTPGVVGVIYGLTQVGEAGGFGASRVLVPMLAGLVLLGGFVAWALHRGERALIDVRLLRHRSVATSSALLLLTGVALYGAMLLLPLYWQQVRGEDALHAGLLLVPQGIGALASRSLAGRLTDSIGGRWVALAGFAVITLGTIPFAFADEHTSTWWLMATLVVRGFGLGAVVIPLMTGAYVGLQRHEMPDASILTRVAQQLGGSLGIAVLAMILAHSVTDAGGVISGFHAAFWWATGLSGLAVALSLALPARAPAPAAGR